MTGVINYLREGGGKTQGIYVCTDWYDNELSYYLGSWPADKDRMESSFVEEIGEWLENSSTYDGGEISISWIDSKGDDFMEDWAAEEVDDPDKVLNRIIEIVRSVSDPENKPLKRIKEKEAKLRDVSKESNITTDTLCLFAIRAWYTYDGVSEKQWDLQYLLEV